MTLQTNLLEIRLAQAVTRAQQMLAAQLPLSEKERVATDIIRNDSDVASLEREAARVWDAVTARLSS